MSTNKAVFIFSFLSLFCFQSSIVHASSKDCETSYFKTAKIWPEFSPETVDVFSEDIPEEFYFWFPGDLSVGANDEGSLVFERNFRFRCGASFSNFSERIFEADLELLGMALQVKLESKETDKEPIENHDQLLMAGFYSVSNFKVIEPTEEKTFYQVLWSIQNAESVYSFTFFSTKEPNLEELSKFLGEKIVFVKEPVGFEHIEAYDENGRRADFNTYVSGALDGSSSKTEFQRYFDEDFVIQREGFGRYGYYQEITKPLSSGGSLRIRIERYDSFFWDPYGRRWPRYYRDQSWP